MSNLKERQRKTMVKVSALQGKVAALTERVAVLEKNFKELGVSIIPPDRDEPQLTERIALLENHLKVAMSVRKKPAVKKVAKKKVARKRS